MATKQAKVVVFGIKKGGVGKSTLACNVASCLANQGFKVAIWDCDSNETCADFVKYRNELIELLEGQGKDSSNVPYIKIERYKSDVNLVKDLQQASKDYDYIIIDTGGYENMAFKSAVTASDVVYVPFAPSTADVNQVIPTLQAIISIEQNLKLALGDEAMVDARLIQARVASTSRTDMLEAKELCKGLLKYASISSVMIPEKKIYKKCYEKGLGLSDRPLGKDSKPFEGRATIEMLVDEINGDREVECPREIE